MCLLFFSLALFYICLQFILLDTYMFDDKIIRHRLIRVMKYHEMQLHCGQCLSKLLNDTPLFVTWSFCLEKSNHKHKYIIFSSNIILSLTNWTISSSNKRAILNLSATLIHTLSCLGFCCLPTSTFFFCLHFPSNTMDNDNEQARLL